LCNHQLKINATRLFLLSIFLLSSAILAGDLPKPEITKGRGESCVADKDFMRLNHMDMLMHDRIETVHKGDRNVKASLKECIACHAIDGPDKTAITVKNPKHFCRSCHDYAAVTIDCFQCHASRPDIKKAKKLKIEQMMEKEE